MLLATIGQDISQLGRHHAQPFRSCHHGERGDHSTIASSVLIRLPSQYMYYALTTLRIPIPWKRAVTTLQILQFIIDLGVVYFASYNYFVGAYNIPLPFMGKCAAGKEHAVSA